MSKDSATPAIAGLAVGIAFVILFSIFVRFPSYPVSDDQIVASANPMPEARTFFSLLPVSDYLANRKVGDFFDVLKTKKVEAAAWRLKNPEEVCFKVDGSTVKSYLFLDKLTKEADANVMMPIIAGNRYDGYGMKVGGPEAVSLIRAFDFHHDSETRTIRGISDEAHTYSCNIEYNGNQYFLQIRFYSLSSLNEYAGYLPITVTDESLDRRIAAVQDSTLYRWFNNTVVVKNKSGSWITFEIRPESVPAAAGQEFLQKPVTVTLPPDTAWDVYLGVNLGSNDTGYDYRVREYPWVRGHIFLKNYPDCMGFDTARSLYAATKFPFKTPSYVPQGYEYKCMQADTASVKLFYSNQTFYPSYMGESLVEGQVRISISDRDRYYGSLIDSPEAFQDDNDRARSEYKDILKSNPAINPQLIDINGRTAWAKKQRRPAPEGQSFFRTAQKSPQLLLCLRGLGFMTMAPRFIWKGTCHCRNS